METIIVPAFLDCSKIRWVNTSVSNSSDTLWTLISWAMLAGLVHIIFYAKFSKYPQNTCTVVILFNRSSKITIAPKYQQSTCGVSTSDYCCLINSFIRPYYSWSTINTAKTKQGFLRRLLGLRNIRTKNCKNISFRIK